MFHTSLSFRLLLVAPLIFLAVRFGHSPAQSLKAESPVQLVNGYPQFQLRGQPFFAHSAAFFYNRIPRDEWGASLVKLKEMGINTVDLYLAWNWHEPEEGKLDFDGRTNPRRDVKHLLEMIDEMGFAAIVRPGPVILNEWRNGGYSDWLLARPEFQMHEVARLDGHYPPLAGVGASNSEEASRQWLANETHLKYTRKWFGDVMRELLIQRQATNGGNLIAIQLDDDQAINRANYNGPVFWKYMNTLAGYLREAGATVPLYINPTDMRVSAAGAPHGIGAMGQWYFNFGGDPALRWEDTATLQFYVETLKTQPRFPPMIIEYQAGWYGTGEDSYAKVADPSNTLLSSRLMLGHGLRGLNYFPAQDTLYPAGYEVPWANHHYVWESALTLDRKERPRAEAVHRNGRLIAGLGRELASAHKAADIGLIYPISSYDQATLTREDILRISRAQMQVQQYCQLNQVAVEYLDLEFQPLEQLKRHKALLLPVFDEKTAAQGREEISAANEPGGDKEKGRQGDRGKRRLSEAAEQKLVAYVRAGGKLIVTPVLPEGDAIKQIAGDSIVMPDFWRDIPVEPGKVRREAVIANVQASLARFLDLLQKAGVRREVEATVTAGSASLVAVGPNLGATNLIATKLVAGNGGFVNVVSFDDRTMRARISVNDPASSQTRIDLPEFTLRPRDAMLLPLRLPLGDGEIYYATAELIEREAANGRMAMRFYAPDAADVVLSLPHAPQGAVSIDGAPITANYDAGKKWLTIKLVPPRARKTEDASGRREHEHDVEIVYEKGLPELNIKSTRLIIGENNSVPVEVANRSAQPLKGKLQLTAARGFNSEAFTLDVDLKPGESRLFNFNVPLGAKAVEGDLVVLRAELESDAENKRCRAPSVTAEIAKRFKWRIFPQAAWPVRAGAAQAIDPPLLYPSDDNATVAKFNIRFTNNSPQEITLSRKSVLVNSLPLKLRPDEEYISTYTYNFAPGEKSALNPFVVTISDGTLTETANVGFVALRKGEAVAFAFDIDRDGFDDYVLENEHLRLIVSPNAGARAFALINKRTGQNVFTSVGGLRDKFVELDPADPTRNARRRRGMYGTFNRPYAAEIVEGMGKRVTLKLRYDAPDVYPAGVQIERAIALNAGDEFFTVDYRITPNAKTVDGKQAFWSASSIVVGDPNLKAKGFVAADGAFDFSAAKTRTLGVQGGQGGWIGAMVAEGNTFAVLWRAGEVGAAEVEMKDFSSLLNLKFKPFANAGAHSYRLVFYFGAMAPAQIPSARARMLGE
jgi:hypothetical protein